MPKTHLEKKWKEHRGIGKTTHVSRNELSQFFFLLDLLDIDENVKQRKYPYKFWKDKEFEVASDPEFARSSNRAIFTVSWVFWPENKRVSTKTYKRRC